MLAEINLAALARCSQIDSELATKDAAHASVLASANAGHAEALAALESQLTALSEALAAARAELSLNEQMQVQLVTAAIAVSRPGENPQLDTVLEAAKLSPTLLRAREVALAEIAAAQAKLEALG